MKQTEYKEGGNIIDFNPNHVPSKRIINYAKKIKQKYSKIWDIGGNIFGNEAFVNLERVSKRGYWLDSEEWMYIKWRSYVARHQHDFRIEGVIAMLKWADVVNKGWAYMKDLIEAKIEKQGWKTNKTTRMKQGGSITETYKQKFNEKYNFNPNESHSLEEVSDATGISLKGLQEIYNKGIGAYKTNPSSVRPNVKSKEQWAMARVYSAVMGGKASKVDANELKMYEGGIINNGKGFVFKDLDSDYKQVYQFLASKNIDGKIYYFSRLNIYPQQNVFTIELEDGKEIGRATLNEKENYLINIRVDDEYRRKGLALNLYEFIEIVTDKKLKPSPDKISKEAKNLWLKRNPNLQMKLGGNVGDCIDYIQNSESIKNNGYYLHIKNMNNYVSSNSINIPKIKSLCLITFNSGNQKNLKAVDTVNSLSLASEIAKLLNIDIEIAKVIVYEQTRYSKKITMDMLEAIKNENIIVADKDTIVCTNLSMQYDKGEEVEKYMKEGGNVEPKINVTKSILSVQPILEAILIGGNVDGYKIKKLVKKKKHYGIVYDLYLLNTKKNNLGFYEKRIVDYDPETKKIGLFKQGFSSTNQGKYYLIWSDSELKMKDGGNVSEAEKPNFETHLNTYFTNNGVKFEHHDAEVEIYNQELEIKKILS